MRDTYLDAWAKTRVEAVNTDAYAKATGTMLDTYLSASSPFREAVEKALLRALEQLSILLGLISLGWQSESRILKCGATIWMPSWTGLRRYSQSPRRRRAMES